MVIKEPWTYDDAMGALDGCWRRHLDAAHTLERVPQDGVGYYHYSTALIRWRPDGSKLVMPAGDGQSTWVGALSPSSLRAVKYVTGWEIKMATNPMVRSLAATSLRVMDGSSRVGRPMARDVVVSPSGEVTAPYGGADLLFLPTVEEIVAMRETLVDFCQRALPAMTIAGADVLRATWGRPLVQLLKDGRVKQEDILPAAVWEFLPAGSDGTRIDLPATVAQWLENSLKTENLALLMRRSRTKQEFIRPERMDEVIVDLARRFATAARRVKNPMKRR